MSPQQSADNESPGIYARGYKGFKMSACRDELDFKPPENRPQTSSSERQRAKYQAKSSKPESNSSTKPKLWFAAT
jgi:hypothetical protein